MGLSLESGLVRPSLTLHKKRHRCLSGFYTLLNINPLPNLAKYPMKFLLAALFIAAVVPPCMAVAAPEGPIVTTTLFFLPETSEPPVPVLTPIIVSSGKPHRREPGHGAVIGGPGRNRI